MRPQPRLLQAFSNENQCFKNNKLDWLWPVEGMKGVYTRKQLKKGNVDKFEDQERQEKINARKERIATGKASKDDKLHDKE